MSNQLISDNDTVNYQAFITGRSYEEEDYPQLDSIIIDFKKQTINKTVVIEKPVVTKKKLITTSPSVTAGYDPINRQWGVMVGVSVNFNIW